MVHMYILENKEKKHYTGITALSPDQRLKRHNNGDVYSTKFGRPWKIVCVEGFATIQEAREREKQIKSWKGGNAFKQFIFRVAGSSNGRIPDSESGHLGSNPSPAALERNENRIV